MLICRNKNTSNSYHISIEYYLKNYLVKTYYSYFVGLEFTKEPESESVSSSISIILCNTNPLTCKPLHKGRYLSKHYTYMYGCIFQKDHSHNRQQAFNFIHMPLPHACMWDIFPSSTYGIDMLSQKLPNGSITARLVTFSGRLSYQDIPIFGYSYVTSPVKRAKTMKATTDGGNWRKWMR